MRVSPGTARKAIPTIVIVLLAAAAVVRGEPPPATLEPAPPTTQYEEIDWHPSRAVGKPSAGRLLDGVLLTSDGADFFTWDPCCGNAPTAPGGAGGPIG